MPAAIQGSVDGRAKHHEAAIADILRVPRQLLHDFGIDMEYPEANGLSPTSLNAGWQRGFALLDQ